jgi:hypothetical protein
MMRWSILPGIIGAVLLAAQFPLRAEPPEGDPASGRAVATRLCSSCLAPSDSEVGRWRVFHPAAGRELDFGKL